MADIEIKDLPIATPISTTSVPVQTAAGVTGRVPLGSTDIRDLGAVYGSLYYSGAGATITLTTQNTWYGFTNATAGKLLGITADVADATADHLTIPAGYGGVYRMTLTACYSTSAAGSYELSAHVNGTECARGCATRRYLSAGDVGSVAGHSIVQLAAGAEVSIRARCTSASTKTLTVERICLSLERVGA